ncbi:hypothetical protein [Phorcysia thermohydrogeniphila]|uniref:Uncharacterized protein n=1 Tax=Phorcysia thermohydrogeniphila TaxID=936138 RepID=A0A4R1G753_9BACT|nr:hypothetical protein [Phorcysia thermohydrogeniphila]TCK03338.1 hypothetical protein CLV27_1410 [Phorcysia thermohydrogeniphila]
MKVLRKLEDDRYLIVEAEVDNRIFIYLKDKQQKTESLGIPEKRVDLDKMWEKHRTEKDFCLPCELLLLLEQKVITAENSVAELGLTLERLQEFKTILNR